MRHLPIKDTFEIQTKHLRLVSISLDYAEPIFKEFTAEITKYMFPQPAEHISETENFISSTMKGNMEGTNIQLVMLDNETNEFLGCIGLHDPHTATPEFGIWLKKSAHGKHFGFEAIQSLYEWAEQNLEFDYIVYPVVKDNVPSRKIPERLGGVVAREILDKKNAKGETQPPMLEYHLPSTRVQ